MLGGVTSSSVAFFKMADVLNGRVPHTEAVLYAPKINKEAVLAAIRELKQNVSATIRTTNEMVHTIDDGLAATNSNRFYKNATATAQVNKLNTMSSDMDGLMDLFGTIDENRIAATIDSYNSSLVDIKKKTRMELLEDAAQEADGQKLQKTETHRSFYPDNGGNHSYYHEEKNGTTKVVTKRYATGAKNEKGELEYITKEDTYIWIQCSGDPSTIESRFQSAGIDLPYNPSKIIDL